MQIHQALLYALNALCHAFVQLLKPPPRKKMEPNEAELDTNELREVGDLGLGDDAAEHVREGRFEGDFDLWQWGPQIRTSGQQVL